MSHEKYRIMLCNRLEELGARLEEIETTLDAPRPKDWDDSATEREGDEVLERLGSSGQAEIARIRAALRRIEDDEYGVCVNCGEPIPEGRLDLLPDAALCTRCAAQVHP
ncbi:TraR/DksA family transcriptional regulator [Salipiger bermudensis]|uniref:TraR/DksA family transcriptional regulator n=1 Tax=Salipiger bermudensis TaxID=344736 RepID=UPI001C99DF11|nr:TraR/DksA family transcriptional regulator [Salipiger bermudensis]MBY6006651.1 TraR/DksA family transcriptional regulator [Salipiger bermudensis]